MLATASPYLMAFSAITFSALSALTLVSWINAFDPPAAGKPAASIDRAAA